MNKLDFETKILQCFYYEEKIFKSSLFDRLVAIGPQKLYSVFAVSNFAEFVNLYKRIDHTLVDDGDCSFCVVRTLDGLQHFFVLDLDYQSVCQSNKDNLKRLFNGVFAWSNVVEIASIPLTEECLEFIIDNSDKKRAISGPLAWLFLTSQKYHCRGRFLTV